MLPGIEGAGGFLAQGLSSMSSLSNLSVIGFP